MRHEKIIKVICLLSAFIMVDIIFNVSPAFAHKVNIFAYVEGAKIMTESYFNDGAPCKDSIIQVFDQEGKEILKGQTDIKGIFSFDIASLPQKDMDLTIVLTASLGHKAKYTLKATEFDAMIPQKDSSDYNTTKTIDVKKADDNIRHADVKASTPLETEQVQKVIEESVENAVEKSTKSLKRAFVQMEKRVRFSDIIGGIGYIFGIMGLILFFKRRNK